MTSYFRCLSVDTTHLTLAKMSRTMLVRCQGALRKQGKVERLRSSSAGLQDSRNISEKSEPSSVVGHSWSLRTHQSVETSSQCMYLWTVGAPAHAAGGEQMVPLTPSQEPSSQITRPRRTKAEGGTRLIPRTAVCRALATSQPHKKPPAGAWGWGRSLLQELGMGTPGEQEHSCRWTAGVRKEAKIFKPHIS